MKESHVIDNCSYCGFDSPVPMTICPKCGSSTDPNTINSDKLRRLKRMRKAEKKRRTKEDRWR